MVKDEVSSKEVTKFYSLDRWHFINLWSVPETEFGIVLMLRRMLKTNGENLKSFNAMPENYIIVLQVNAL